MLRSHAVLRPTEICSEALRAVRWPRDLPRSELVVVRPHTYEIIILNVEDVDSNYEATLDIKLYGAPRLDEPNNGNLDARWK